MSTEGIVLAGASKRFASFVALHPTDLHLPAGQFTLLAGANGAGKSTLLRLLAGVSRPSRGRVLVNGHDPQRHGPTRATLGLLSHHTLLYGDLSAEENLAFFARLHGLQEVDQRVQQALEEVGLAAHGRRRLRAFSRGMRQRLALARATLHEPSVLLLDEPFTGLDPPACRLLERRLHQFKEQGRTLVMITHHLSEAAALADRLVGLRRGRLCCDRPWSGSARELAEACAPFLDEAP